MEIVVLGTGCAKCKNVYGIIEEVVKEAGINVNLRKEEDILKIKEYNVMATPAVTIDGKVYFQGRVPSEKELRECLSANNKGNLKELVKQRYNEVALLSTAEASKCCCNPAAPSKKVFTIMSEDYSKLKGYEPDADLGVGCGLPTQYAGIKEGDTVVDLGSGAGNDCFIAREEVGNTGKVIGIDFAPNMLEKARKNAEKRGFRNIEFLQGDIEDMPLPDASVDVVVSNCVLNLLPRKDMIFKEIYRVLKTGAHFCVSDVVINGVFPKEFTDNAAMYAGCIASAIQREDYLGEIEKAGFKNIIVVRTKTVIIPDDVLEEHLDKATIEKYKAGNVGIYSITVIGVKE
ncbi:MAG: arsenite methyltransferase [Bacteroidales bacterium]|nr:arsenite methyltransferase [Bacteroidales bacterium]